MRYKLSSYCCRILHFDPLGSNFQEKMEEKEVKVYVITNCSCFWYLLDRFLVLLILKWHLMCLVINSCSFLDISGLDLRVSIDLCCKKSWHLVNKLLKKVEMKKSTLKTRLEYSDKKFERIDKQFDLLFHWNVDWFFFSIAMLIILIFAVDVNL